MSDPNKKTAHLGLVWQKAILKSDLPATTRHVLLTISTYMDRRGQCYPTIKKTLCPATSLSKRCVIEHIKKAEALGWVNISKHDNKGQNWANNQYQAAWPITDKIAQPETEKVVTLTTPDSAKVVTLTHKGGYSNRKSPCRESNPNYKDKQPNKQSMVKSRVSANDEVGDCFEKLWAEINPKLLKTRRADKRGTKDSFTRLAKEHGLESLNAAVRQFYSDKSVTKENYKFAPAIKYCLSGRKFEGFLGSDEEQVGSYVESRLAIHERQISNN